jgi:hypothetical protein
VCDDTLAAVAAAAVATGGLGAGGGTAGQLLCTAVSASQQRAFSIFLWQPQGGLHGQRSSGALAQSVPECKHSTAAALCAETQHAAGPEPCNAAPGLLSLPPAAPAATASALPAAATATTATATTASTTARMSRRGRLLWMQCWSATPMPSGQRSR